MTGTAGTTRTTGTIRTTRTRLARAGRDPRGAAFWRGPARSRPPSKRMGTILHICAVRQERNVPDSRRPAVLRAPSCGWVDPSCGWVPHGNAPPGGRMSRTPPRATVWTALALLALVPVTIPSAHATPAAPSGAGARVETGGHAPRGGGARHRGGKTARHGERGARLRPHLRALLGRLGPDRARAARRVLRPARHGPLGPAQARPVLHARQPGRRSRGAARAAGCGEDRPARPLVGRLPGQIERA